LDGTVSDDGLPVPPGAVTVSWTQTAGPTVTISNADQIDSSAVLPAAGNYTFMLSAGDGALTSTAMVTVSATAVVPPTTVVEVRVGSGRDDVEELVGGRLYTSSSDLELTEDGGLQTVGLRFAGVGVPAGATIVRAWVQFTVDEVSSVATVLSIRGRDVGDAARFRGNFGVSGVGMTAVSVPWSPVAWPVVGAAGVDQRSPDLSSVVQAIVGRPDWVSGNALALVITGTGKRVAESYEGSRNQAPLLHIEYTMP